METRQCRKFNVRVLVELGENYEKQLKQGKKYGFNYEEERRIYKYACDSCKKREIKKLSEDRKFNTY